MNALAPDETLLVGQWIMVGGKAAMDAVCRRIEWLTAESLTELGRDSSGWDTLYVDSRDGRLWERTYPLSEMHGGGPPTLRLISREAAGERFIGLKLL